MKVARAKTRVNVAVEACTHMSEFLFLFLLWSGEMEPNWAGPFVTKAQSSIHH